MIVVVVIFNVLIAFLCFYVAFRVWKLRQTLGQVADTLLSVERKAHALLYGSPDAILKGQIGLHQLRSKYQQLEPQLQRARQALALLSLGKKVWRQKSTVSRRHRTNSVDRTPFSRLNRRGRQES